MQSSFWYWFKFSWHCLLNGTQPKYDDCDPEICRNRNSFLKGQRLMEARHTAREPRNDEIVKALKVPACTFQRQMEAGHDSLHYTPQISPLLSIVVQFSFHSTTSRVVHHPKKIIPYLSTTYSSLDSLNVPFSCFEV